MPDVTTGVENRTINDMIIRAARTAARAAW